MVSNKKRVAVVGAGISGLVTAKTLARDGLDVCVLEKDAHLGGTWASSRTYPGLRTNNTKQTYEFSDHPYPDDAELYPRADQVRDYLEAYADRFGIRELIQFNQEVISIDYLQSDRNRFSVKCSSTNDQSDGFEGEFDFVVICNGVFHSPNIPAIRDADRFEGRVLYSSQVTESSYNKGDKIVVVGGGKSAFDCTTYAARQGFNPTLLYRRPQWMAPRYLPGGKIPGDWLVTSRFMALMLGYHRMGIGGRLMHSIGRPLIWLWWRLIGLGWKKDLGIPSNLVPTEKLPSGVEKLGVGSDFYEVVNEGKAQAIRGTAKQFTSNGIILDDGTELPADVVVFATGWQQSLSVLSKELQHEITGQGYIRLYRRILPPSVQNIGFIGQASSIACQLTAEIGAHWLSEHLLGSLELPSVDEMNSEIDKAHAWADEYLPNRGTEGFVGPYLSHYVDELIREMGLPLRRNKGFFSEYFGPFRGSRYAELAAERGRARS